MRLYLAGVLACIAALDLARAVPPTTTSQPAVVRGRIVQSDGKPAPAGIRIVAAHGVLATIYYGGIGELKAFGKPGSPMPQPGEAHPKYTGCGFGPWDVRLTQRLSVPLTNGEELQLDVPKLTRVWEVGDPAPDFKAKTLDGRVIRMSDMKGKVVLLDFWATWCGMCIAELPNLAKIVDDFDKCGDFAIVGVSVDKGPPELQRFVQRKGIAWPQIWEGPADRGAVALEYNVSSTPTTFLIGRDGRIAARDVYGDELRAAIEKLLVNANKK